MGKAKKTAPVKVQIVDFHTKVGVTLNMGDYESYRIDCGVTLRAEAPAANDTELNAIKDQLSAKGWDMVNSELDTKVAAARKEIRKAAKKRKRENGYD